jgi:hypothetical protein
MVSSHVCRWALHDTFLFKYHFLLQILCFLFFFSDNIIGDVANKQQTTGKGNEEIETVCPEAVINYTKHMGGVDVSDQKREYYRVGRT